MTITQRLIQRNYTPTRKGYTIKRVVLHTYGGKGTSLYNWFNRENGTSSAHYAVMKDGKVEQYVKDADIAWHAGTIHSTAKPNNNYESIGIEHQDDGNSGDSVRTPELYESASQLVAMLCKKYSVPCVLLARDNAWGRGIALHNFYTTAKPCPAGLDSNRIVNRAREILNINPTNPMDNTTLWAFLQKYRPDVCKVYTQANCNQWWASYGQNEIPVQYDNLFKENENLKQQVTALSAKVSQTEQELVVRTLELKKANEKIKELNGNVEALESSLQVNQAQYEKDKEELEAQVAREENKNKLLKEQNEALTISNNNQSVLIDESETKIENQRVAIIRLEKKLANCETSMTSAIETLVQRFINFIFNLFKRK
jgi:hypothetical protein